MQRTMCNLALTAALGVAAPAVAAPPSDLDALVARTLEAFGAPGLSLAIVENGQAVHTRGYGVRKLGDEARSDEHTIFPIGSCTKAFTAAALALLVDEGKLHWDDKVSDRLPGFRMYDSYTTAEMTVRDLLAHNSGLSLGAGDLLWLGGSDYTRKGLIERLRYIKPARSFRSGYAYDNVLYAVAGQLVEEVSGLTWEAFVENRILAPLGMKDTTVPQDAALKSRNRASLHARLGGELRGLGPNQPLSDKGSGLESASIAPAGSIHSSAVDMALWMKVQLSHGALPGGRRLFSEKQWQEMWTGVTIEPPDSLPAVLDARRPNFNLYALGWSVEDYRGHRIVNHTGGVFGGTAIVMLLPEKDVGIAAMVNSEDGAARRAIVYTLLDHYLGLPPQDWIGNYKAALDEIFAKGRAALKQLPMGPGTLDQSASVEVGPSLPLEKYANVYEDEWYGTVTVSHDGKGLHLQFDRTPGLHAPLEHVRYDTFRTRFPDRNLEDAYITFALNPDASVDQAKMQAVSPLADFSFNYQDLLLRPKR